MANKQTEFENNNSSLPADDNWLNMVNTELKNVCIGTGQTIDAGVDQNIKGMAIIASQASLYCVDTGTANAYVLNPVSPLQAPPVIRTGMSIKFATGNANTGSSNINAYGFGNILAKNQDGTNLGAGDIPANVMVEMYYNGTNWILIKPATKATTTTQGIVYLPSDILISNNAGTPNTKIDLSAGNMIFDDGSGSINSPTILTGDLANLIGTSDGMLDAGTKGNTADYSVFAIYNPTTNVIKPLASLSRTAPTLPTGFTKKEYRGKILTDASGNILPFKQYKDRFEISGALPFKAFPANSTSFVDINFATNYAKDVEQIVNCFLYATITSGINSYLYVRAKGYTGDGQLLTVGETNTASVVLRLGMMFRIVSDSTGTWQYRTSNSNSFVLNAGHGFWLNGWTDHNLKIRG